MERFKLLIVDDDLNRAQKISDLLKHKKFEVTVLGEGKEAIKVIRENDFHLLLTNVLLNDMDGVELVTAIQEARPDLPVIIMSSPNHASKAIKALYAGAHHFIREPFDIEDLVRTIDKLLRYPKQDLVTRRLIPYLRETVHLDIPSDFSFLSIIVQYLTDVLIRLNFQKEDDIHVKIALLEAITNAMEHGNRKMVEKHVWIDMEITEQKVVFRIRDEGAGFDFKNLPDPTQPENITKLRGRGVFMIYRIMDEVKFNRKGNEITMTKFYDERKEPE